MYLVTPFTPPKDQIVAKIAAGCNVYADRLYYIVVHDTSQHYLVEVFAHIPQIRPLFALKEFFNTLENEHAGTLYIPVYPVTKTNISTAITQAYACGYPADINNTQLQM